MFLLPILLNIFLVSEADSALSAVHSLHTTIFTDYNTAVRPVKTHTDKVKVSVSFDLFQIVDVDVKNQYMELNMAVTFNWFDEYLGWDPSANSNIERISISYDKIWRPDIHLYNGLEMDESNVMRKMDAIITTSLQNGVYVGNVSWSFPARYRFFCFFNTINFPFESHACALRFGSWNYALNEMDITYPSTKAEINLEYYVENDAFNLDGNYFMLERDSFNDRPQSILNVVVAMSRRSLYYGVNLILPTVVITQAALIGFFSPGSSGEERSEKINLGMGALLAMTVMLTIVQDMMPITSDYIPRISWYFILDMFLIFLGMAASWFIISTERKFKFLKRPSPKVRKFFFGTLAKLLCIRVPPGVDTEGIAENRPATATLFGTLTQEEKEVAEIEWKFMAEVLDKLMLYLFTILHLLLSTIVLVIAKVDGKSIRMGNEVVGTAGDMPDSKSTITE